MSGAIPVLPQHAFMAWTKQTLHLPGNSSIYIETKDELVNGLWKKAVVGWFQAVPRHSTWWERIRTQATCIKSIGDRDVNPDVGNTNQHCYIPGGGGKFRW